MVIIRHFGGRIGHIYKMFGQDVVANGTPRMFNLHINIMFEEVLAAVRDPVAISSTLNTMFIVLSSNQLHPMF